MRRGNKYKREGGVMEPDKLPNIKWIKNEGFTSFTDGSVFIVALRVEDDKTKTLNWDFDVVEFDCDGEGASLYYRGKFESYTDWDWDDFEYFALLSGDMPSKEAKEE